MKTNEDGTPASAQSLRMIRGLAWLLLIASPACATGALLRRESEAIRSQLDALRDAGAYRCAPRDLAKAEAHLEFLETELDQGNSVRAAAHRRIAKQALASVIARAKGCQSDRDRDGVLDENDACPDVPGPKELLGCPDRDGDGISDPIDRCPEVPEDKDGVKDDDGCPEVEDRDGDGVLDGEDACPDTPGPVENRGCPIGDRDGDRILDNADKCPDTPEDPDDFEDEDGCPDPDNDGDGILDAADRCPLQPETKNGIEDEDGCPDVKLDLVEVRRDIGKIEIKQTVYFDTAKATIKPVSFGLLNQVAAVLKSNASMHVLVEGHTDSVGSNATNQRLSDQRADSVREYLIAQGIEPERLTAQGFGEEKPIDTNRTRAGRERNRRVEFTITKE